MIIAKMPAIIDEATIAKLKALGLEPGFDFGDMD